MALTYTASPPYDLLQLYTADLSISGASPQSTANATATVGLVDGAPPPLRPSVRTEPTTTVKIPGP